MHWYIHVLKNYAVFAGRARRKEYWVFVLINTLIGFCLGFVMGFCQAAFQIDLSPIFLVYELAILLPSIAVGVRRMHDIGRSGWWIICPIVNIVFTCLKSEPGDNRFGLFPTAE